MIKFLSSSQFSCWQILNQWYETAYLISNSNFKSMKLDTENVAVHVKAAKTEMGKT